MVSNGDRSAAPPVMTVAIAGHSFHVHFTMSSVRLLEDEYGSIMKVGKLLEGISDTKPLFGPVLHILSLGLRDETVDGQPVTEDWLLDNSDTRQIVEYAAVAYGALAVAARQLGDIAKRTGPEQGQPWVTD